MPTCWDKINFNSYTEEVNCDGDAVACMGLLRCLKMEKSTQRLSFFGKLKKNQYINCSASLYGSFVQKKCNATEPDLTISELIMLRHHGKNA